LASQNDDFANAMVLPGTQGTATNIALDLEATEDLRLWTPVVGRLSGRAFAGVGMANFRSVPQDTSVSDIHAAELRQAQTSLSYSILDLLIMIKWPIF
jgi:hypothetical protein